MTEHNLPVPDDMVWVNLTQEEVEELRNKKHELTEYGREQVRKLMNKEPITAKVSEKDYQKVLDLMNNQEPYPDEMFEEAERREKSNRVLQRYNNFYNAEVSGLTWGTHITPEFQQAMALECMLDALRCENLNHEFSEVQTDDINALIEGLYQQGRDYLERVRKLKGEK